MRESSYSFPPQNRAVLSITHMLYDRRGKLEAGLLLDSLTRSRYADHYQALDTTSPLAILNNLTSLTYLTQTSPRIRDILTLDGGLERLLDILRESCMPRETYVPPDLWGLNGPPTARVIPVDRQISLRHNLAFQCVVNIGVRGSEAIRTRVVQAGSLDLVAQILESWLVQHGIAIFAGPLGSVAAVQAVAAGLPVPGVSSSKTSSETNSHPRANSGPTPRTSQAVAGHAARPQTADSSHSGPRASDTDVDMAEADEGTDTASAGADEGMDVDGAEDMPRAGPSTTPRARQPILPMAIQIPPRLTPREVVAQASSAGNSLSGDEVGGIPRATSENNLAAAARQSLLNLSAPRMPQLAQDAVSNQSSPMGTPNRQEIAEPLRATGRRGTIVARPANLAPRNDRENESGASDVGEEVDLPAATVAAGIAAANAQAMEGGGTMLPEGAGPPPNVEIVDGATDLMEDDPDPDAMAAEQARLDMEAGAPPGQPGAAQTPRVATADTTPRQLLTQPPAAENTQIIIANGAPRGFQDLGSYVGVSAILNPDGNRYSDDSILLSLQLLAYLSKYPHVRSAFHHPRRPMHPSFEIGTDYVANPLPERPAYSQTPNVFSLVERFTFRPSPSDPGLFRIPPEIQYWAGVIMRNACRKDEAQGGIRQCANMACGRWESFAREFAKCRRCRKAKYCSKECQSKAWQEGHRFWCSTRSDELHHPAPSDVGERENPADDDDGDEHGGGHGQPGIRQPRLQFAPPLNPPPPTRGRDATTPNNRPTASRTAQDTRVPVTADTGADTTHDIDDTQMNLLRESIGGRQTRPPGAGEPSTARTARSTGRQAEPTHRRQGGASAFFGL